MTASSVAPLYGSACAGWWSSGKETRPEGTKRIAAAFGNVRVWRCWETIANYLPDTKQSIFLDNGNVNDIPKSVDALLAYNDKRHWLSCFHEPENDPVSMTQWQHIQMQAGQYVKDHGEGRIKYVPLLMSETGIPSRHPAHSAEEWFNFDLTNMSCLGADLYQNAKSDADMDTAAEVLGPWLALCVKLDKPFVIGEFGVRRVHPPWSPGISDYGRAKYLTDAIKIMDNTRLPNGNPVVRAVCIYESDGGTEGKKPWNLLGPPGKQAANYSPRAVKVWADRCKAQAAA